MQANHSNGFARVDEQTDDDDSYKKRHQTPRAYRTVPTQPEHTTPAIDAVAAPAVAELGAHKHGSETGIVESPQHGRNDPHLVGLEAVSPTETSPILAEDLLEVDHDLDESSSMYAASQYPAIPLRYQAERFDSTTINSSSRSLYVEDLDYTIENGRRYCGDYFFPNDDLEQDRLRVVHQVFLNLFNFELTSVPLYDPRYVLDIGTGTGEWAIGMAEAYPACEFVGVDISAIQPTAVPHNVFFEVDDCEIDWMRPDDTADLVHLRDMAGAFSDWDFIYLQAFACLKPGGYIEVLDFHDHTSSATSFFDCFPPDTQIHILAQAIDEASIKAGRRRGTHHMNKEILHRAGFVDVQISERAIPLDPHSDAVGKLWLISCLHGVEAIALRLLTKYMGWEPSRVFALCEQVCEEVKSRALKPESGVTLQAYLRVLTARKPVSARVPATESPFEDSADESTING